VSVPIVEAVGLSYAYPDGTDALRGVSFSVKPGERVAIIGRTVPGRRPRPCAHRPRRAECGQGVRGGVAVTAERPTSRRRVGLVFQDPDDQLFMTTVRQDVAFGPTNYGVKGEDLDERVAEALDAVGMGAAASRAPHHLSVGENEGRPRDGLAMRPDVLVLDEPSANLDPEDESRSQPPFTLST